MAYIRLFDDDENELEGSKPTQQTGKIRLFTDEQLKRDGFIKEQTESPVQKLQLQEGATIKDALQKGLQNRRDAYNQLTPSQQAADYLQKQNQKVSEIDFQLQELRTQRANEKENRGLARKIGQKFGVVGETDEYKKLTNKINFLEKEKSEVLNQPERADILSQRPEDVMEEGDTYVKMYLTAEIQISEIDKQLERNAQIEAEIKKLYDKDVSQGQRMVSEGRGTPFPMGGFTQTKNLQKTLEDKNKLSAEKQRIEELEKEYFGEVSGNRNASDFYVRLSKDRKTLEASKAQLRRFTGDLEINKGLFEGIASGATLENIPFAGDAIAWEKAQKTARALEKFDNKQELTPADKATLSEVYGDQYEQTIDRGTGYRVGSSVIPSVSAMAEILVLSGTGGASGATVKTGVSKKILGEVGEETLKEMAEKGVVGLLKEGSKKQAVAQLVSSVTGSAATAATLTAGQPIELAVKYDEFRTPEYALLESDEGQIILDKLNEGDSEFKALTKAMASSFAENWIETAGGELVDTPFEAVQKKVLGEWMAKSGIKSLSGLDNYIAKAGVNGFVAEVFEEELQYAVDATINGQSYEFDAERLIETSMSVGILQGATHGVSLGLGTAEAQSQATPEAKVDLTDPKVYAEHKTKVDNLMTEAGKTTGVEDMTSQRPLDYYQDYVELIQRGGVDEYGQAGFDKLNSLRMEAVAKYGKEATSVFNLATEAYLSDLQAGKTQNVSGESAKDRIAQLKAEAQGIKTEAPAIEAEVKTDQSLKAENLVNIQEDEKNERTSASPSTQDAKTVKIEEVKKSQTQDYDTATAITDSYYIREEESYTLAEDSKPVQINSAVETFVARDMETREYDVVDAKTGISIASGTTEVGAINRARQTISTQGVQTLIESLKQASEATLSPRYVESLNTARPAKASAREQDQGTPRQSARSPEKVSAPISKQVFATKEDALQDAGINIGDTIVINGKERVVRGFSNSVSDTNGINIDFESGNSMTLDKVRQAAKTKTTQKAVERKEKIKETKKKDAERVDKRKKGEFVEDAKKKDIRTARMLAGKTNAKAQEASKKIKEFKSTKEYKDLKEQYSEQITKEAFLGRSNAESFIQSRIDTYGEEAERYYGNLTRRMRAAESYIQALDDLRVYEIDKELIERGLITQTIEPTVDEAMMLTYLQEFKREEQGYPDEVFIDALEEAVAVDVADLQGELKQESLIGEIRKSNTFDEFYSSIDGRFSPATGFDEEGAKPSTELWNQFIDLIYNDNKTDFKPEYDAIYESGGGDKEVLKAVYEKYKTQPNAKMRHAYTQATGKKKISKKVQAQIKAQSRAWFGDENVLFEKEILTPQGNEALGKYHRKWVHIAEKQSKPEDTFAHEAVHKALDLYNTPLRKQRILNEVISKYGEQKLRERWGTQDPSQGGRFRTNLQPAKILKENGRRTITEPSLMALHGTHIDNLESIIENGMAVPSIAITTPEVGFESFGNITLVGNNRIVEDIYNSDIYSKRRPQKYYEADIDIYSEGIGADLQAIYKEFEIKYDLIENYLTGSDFSPDAIIRESKYSAVLAAIFLKSKGIKAEPINDSLGKFDREESRYKFIEIIDQRGLSSEYQSWAKELAYSLVKREVFYDSRGRIKNYTEENILEEMTGRQRGSENFFYGVRSLRASISKRFKGVPDAKKNLGMLKTAEEAEAGYNALEAEFDELAEEIVDDDKATYITKTEALIKNLQNEVGATISEDRIKRALSYTTRNYTAEDINKVKDYLKRLREAPTQYFESKPQRIVNIREFDGIIVPKDSYDRVRNLLDMKRMENIKVVSYDPDIKGDRSAKLKEFGESKFNTGETANTLFDMAEEQLAEDFIAYVNGQKTFTGQIKQFFDDLLEFIKSLTGNASEIKAFYKELHSGKLANKTQGYPEGVKPAFRAVSLNNLLQAKAPVKQSEVKDGKVYETKSAIISYKKFQTGIAGEIISTPESRAETSRTPVEAATGKEKETRAFRRVQERYSEYLEENEESLKALGLTYRSVNLKEDVARAIKFVEENPKIAKRIALGLELPPEGILETNISLAFSEMALENGKIEDSIKAEVSMSRRKTRAGQEIVALRGRVNPLSPTSFINRVVQARKEKIAGLAIDYKIGKVKKSDAYLEKVDTKVKQIRKTLKDANLQQIKIQKAQDFLDKLACR